jgi:hypothetical protein
MGIFEISFVGTAIVCAILVYFNWEKHEDKISGTAQDFRMFQITYLSVFFLMAIGDWLQGPYVYALYADYGYSIGDIGILFISGFGSSMIFGTFVGSIGDQIGRKKVALLYGILYIVSCATKHSPDFKILLFGRFTGGIATSILGTTFECWMIKEHYARSYTDEQLDYTFYLQYFGNGLVAIAAGLIGNFVHYLTKSYVAPFDASIFFLTIGTYVVFAYWNENYGSQTESTGMFSNFSNAFIDMKNDWKIICLGISQSLFEGSMYTFVFMWTPAMEMYYKNIPHGMVFATFMVCYMIGSGIFKILVNKFKVEKYMIVVFIISSLCFLPPVLGIPNGMITFAGFCVFEVAVGIFWPSMGRLKSVYIPERVRSTVMNYFRIPTNVFVVLILVKVKTLPIPIVFAINVALLTIACVSQWRLMQLVDQAPTVISLDK